MQFKQTSEELDANKAKVDKAFLPAVLGDKAWGALLNPMGIWLLNNCAFNGLVDASVANMIRAVNRLDGTGLFDWQIAPIKKPAKKRDYLQSHDGDLVNHARENKVSEIDFQMAEEKRRRQALGDAANREILEEAAALVSRHSSVSHSRTYREREALKKEFDRLVAAKVHPRDVLAGVQAKQETFSGGDITRPHLGGR